HFSDALYHTERPIINAHVVAKYLLSRAVRDAGVKVVLTGEGSDEVFAGYPHFRRDMLLYNRQGQEPETVQRLLKELESSNAVSQGLLLPGEDTTNLASVRQALGFVPSMWEIWAQIGQTIVPLLHPEFAACFQGRDVFRLMLNHLDVQRQMTG